LEKIDVNSIWFDGICKKCGYPVIEMPSDDYEHDYQNMCLNKNCDEHKWHHIGDQEDLEYYQHVRNDEILEPLRFKKKSEI
jgi:predicted DCC family thiol-disulfide oxidoreductase YuxK